MGRAGRVRRHPLGRAVARAAVLGADDPALAEAWQEFRRSRLDRAVVMIHRAVDRGELPAGTDAAVAVELLAAPCSPGRCWGTGHRNRTSRGGRRRWSWTACGGGEPGGLLRRVPGAAAGRAGTVSPDTVTDVTGIPPRVSTGSCPPTRCPAPPLRPTPPPVGRRPTAVGPNPATTVGAGPAGATGQPATATTSPVAGRAPERAPAAPHASAPRRS
ncbi:TetR-like C-terminal domain-containing protein [Kitasatospora sp. NPDC048722]|uniref:TetR-like C-terminal domain-containing protein n=1 Tax=Kitasatospora sp. NPDC048722 TaxID=3155639 RepID=UPI0033DC34B6